MYCFQQDSPDGVHYVLKSPDALGSCSTALIRGNDYMGRGKWTCCSKSVSSASGGVMRGLMSHRHGS